MIMNAQRHTSSFQPRAQCFLYDSPLPHHSMHVDDQTQDRTLLSTCPYEASQLSQDDETNKNSNIPAEISINVDIIAEGSACTTYIHNVKQNKWVDFCQDAKEIKKLKRRGEYYFSFTSRDPSSCGSLLKGMRRPKHYKLMLNEMPRSPPINLS
mmetsp:Transcript_38592/g.44973  ORF Transcript_38592/g.44973 Transcript_38592/m.44973 type:complete len:154 (+) Transcript_38592:72-533(+)